MLEGSSNMKLMRQLMKMPTRLHCRMVQYSANYNSKIVRTPRKFGTGTFENAPS